VKNARDKEIGQKMNGGEDCGDEALPSDLMAKVEKLQLEDIKLSLSLSVIFLLLPIN